MFAATYRAATVRERLPEAGFPNSVKHPTAIPLEPASVFLYAASATLTRVVNPPAAADRGSRYISFQDGWVHLSKPILFGVLVACSAAAVTRSVWDGVYTKEQATRGQATYREECLRCHGESLGGGEGGPLLAGAEFRQKWNGKTAGDLFGVMRKTMPSDDPGNLSSREYADLVAYILSANEYPAGQKDLDRDVAALNEIRIEVKP